MVFIPILTDLAKEVTEELLEVIDDISYELKSDDGLTRDEARLILIERLQSLRAREIGNSMSDRAFDALITYALAKLAH